MKLTMESLFNLDRRVIFVFIFLAVLLPYLLKINLPITPNQIVVNVHDKIEEVGKENGTVLVSFDFDPASKAELEPMARAILHDLFKNNVKVVAMGHWVTGVDMARALLEEAAKEHNKEYGKDYTFLGWKAGAGMLIVNMGQDFHSAFPKDGDGKYDTTKMSVTKDITTIRDFDYIISLAAGGVGIDLWIMFAQAKYDMIIGGGCTAVMAPDYYTYLQSGQLNGLIGGMVGAAEYEKIIDRSGDARAGMTSQSVSHLILIFFIIFGNICYSIGQSRKKKIDSLQEQR
ncbi:hypothetical protein ACFL54_02605 [Planctomycetota bacterium]